MGKHRHGFSAAMACMTAGVLATVALRRAAFSSELHLPNCSRLCYSLWLNQYFTYINPIIIYSIKSTHLNNYSYIRFIKPMNLQHFTHPTDMHNHYCCKYFHTYYLRGSQCFDWAREQNYPNCRWFRKLSSQKCCITSFDLNNTNNHLIVYWNFKMCYMNSVTLSSRIYMAWGLLNLVKQHFPQFQLWRSYFHNYIHLEWLDWYPKHLIKNDFPEFGFPDDMRNYLESDCSQFFLRIRVDQLKELARQLVPNLSYFWTIPLNPYLYQHRFTVVETINRFLLSIIQPKAFSTTHNHIVGALVDCTF